MGGLFGVAAKSGCVLDLFFGTDYHSHLGTKRGGLAVYGENGFDRAIHNIENSPFRTKFERDIEELDGYLGIGCISDNEPQPLLVQSHLGSFAISTVGKIINLDELVQYAYDNGSSHFLEMSGGRINPTELAAALINQRDTIIEGILHAQSLIKGSLTMIIMTPKGLYAARDRLGRTPLVIGEKEDGYCVSFESFAFINLGYANKKELGPGEIVFVTPEGYETVSPARNEMQICSFLWVYYGYPTSTYEGLNVEQMRYSCGDMLARRDEGTIKADIVAGVPDSGIAHAIGYANRSGVPFARPFIKYTPTWPRSFMPQKQSQRALIAKMKLIPVDNLIKGKSMLLIDDSIVRGTQLRETTEFLYHAGAQDVHVRPACPPTMFGCKFLNFARSNSDLDLITRRIIFENEGEVVPKNLLSYTNPDSAEYCHMVGAIKDQLKFSSLRYHRLDDMILSIGLPIEKLCTYCWSGREGCNNN